MIVKMFKPQFAPLVESGQKRQTVRPTPKRIPRIGDDMSLREWSGKPYRSPQRELRKAKLTDIRRIIIHDDGIHFENAQRMKFRESGIEDRILNDFAKADGFECWQAMRDWFAQQHGLPFTGVLYKW